MKQERLQLIPQIQRIVRNYYENLYYKKVDKLGEMEKFLETYSFPKLNQEEAESLNRPTAADETEAVIINSQHTKALDQMVSQNFTKHLRKS